MHPASPLDSGAPYITQPLRGMCGTSSRSGDAPAHLPAAAPHPREKIVPMPPTPPAAAAPRILIVRIGAMGDVLHALPAVAALRQRLPAAHIGWAIEPRWASLLAASTPAGAPLVNRIHLVPVREWKAQPVSAATARSILSLRRQLRAAHYDIAVDLQGTIRSAVVGRLAGASVFAGSSQPRESLAALLYSQKIPLSQPHVVQQACEILGGATGHALAPVDPVLLPDATAEAWCNALLSSLPEPTRLVVFSVGGGWGAKRWPPERYGALAAALKARGYTTLVAAATADNDLALQVVAASSGAAQIAVSDLPRLAALLRRAALCIGGDTGPLHLAAALGTPAVGIYGPTDPARNGPFTPLARVLRNPQSVTSHSRIQQTEAGLLSIPVADVIHSAMELLQAAAPESE
ncbi:MAG: glycosyltransferase family 9 protein [Acidobacteriaceae bacterium]|nr:glycosyltransferase family 9 protein [Acidobacteriaceae bacterium]